MKTLAVAALILGGLAAWSPSARADEYSTTPSARDRREQAESTSADSDNSGRSREHAAATSRDHSRTSPDVTAARESQKVVADRELSTNAHNGKTITANFQAVYDNMSDAQKKTAGTAFRSHVNAPETIR